MELTFQQEVESHPHRKGHLILLSSTYKNYPSGGYTTCASEGPTHEFFF